METKADGEVQSKDLAFATSIPSRAAHFSFRISKLFLFQNFKALFAVKEFVVVVVVVGIIMRKSSWRRSVWTAE
ncbi:hypothetical protein BDL97_07G008400 [Sphagnum fallax]|nr:hypothetical protein BDL97_07G008400 [Sphagnum fallax]